MSVEFITRTVRQILLCASYAEFLCETNMLGYVCVYMMPPVDARHFIRSLYMSVFIYTQMFISMQAKEGL